MEASPAPFSEELIVRYLLGELPEEQRVEIEDRAFQDQQCLQSILEIENDLIDEYVRGKIPGSKRDEFESHFLASDVRRRKVDFARALATVASEGVTPEVSQAVSVARQPVVRQRRLLDFLRGLSPAAAFSYAAAALIIIAGAAWLISDSIRLRSELNQLRAERQIQDAQRRQLEEQLAAERNRQNGLNRAPESPQKEEFARAHQPDIEPTVTPPHQPAVVALALLPGLARSSSAVPKLEVTTELRTVRLNVGIDPQDDYPRYRVELRSPGGGQVWSQDNISARATSRGRSLNLNLPAKVLQTGRYELAVQGIKTGAGEDLGYYYFEVLKK